MTITEFLLARIAEDEREANEHLGAEYYQDGLWPEECAARVLAECAAKRAIIEGCTAVDDWQDEYAVGLRDDTLQSLTAVYSDHPDYQQEWAA